MFAQPYIANAFAAAVQILFGSGITLGALSAITLNILFFHVGPRTGPAVAGTPGHVIRLDQVNEMTEPSSSTPSATSSRARRGPWRRRTASVR